MVSTHGLSRAFILLSGCLLAAGSGSAGPPASTNRLTGAPVLVRATPLAATAGQFGRTVEALDGQTIRQSRSASVPALLEEATSVHVSERGAPGVQADLSLRGSTFEQVLVTLDGLPVTDAQTAHHTMNLPFPPGALEQITVIPGPGSALFGPAAFAGVVDLTPRRPASTGMSVESAFGTFDTLRTAATADLAGQRHAATVASSFSRSDGFREGNDYETWSAWASCFVDMDSGALRVSAGHADRDFGAQDFYASYPSRERTTTTLVDLAPEFEPAPDWLLRAIARYRRHRDEFILVADDPSLYRNEHVTDTFTERITLVSPDSAAGKTAVGIERSDAALDSSNLGDRSASTSSAFVQHRLPWDACTADVGLRVDGHSDWDAEWSPSVSLAVPLDASVTWRLSAARGIRPPSFTERYYHDPANVGNDTLEPEEAWGGETGFDLRLPRGTRASFTYFVRDTENLIDWVRDSGDAPWQAMNVGKATFQGGEGRLAGSLGPCRWETAYRYTGVDADAAGLESKYALNVARHDARVTVGLRETLGFAASVTARYRDVPTLDRYWLTSARVAQRVGNVVVFAGGRNLADRRYEEIPGVPTAGRFMEFGVEVAL